MWFAVSNDVEPVECTTCGRRHAAQMARCPFCNAEVSGKPSGADLIFCPKCLLPYDGRKKLSECPHCHGRGGALADERNERERLETLARTDLPGENAAGIGLVALVLLGIAIGLFTMWKHVIVGHHPLPYLAVALGVVLAFPVGLAFGRRFAEKARAQTIVGTQPGLEAVALTQLGCLGVLFYFPLKWMMTTKVGARVILTGTVWIFAILGTSGLAYFLLVLGCVAGLPEPTEIECRIAYVQVRKVGFECVLPNRSLRDELELHKDEAPPPPTGTRFAYPVRIARFGLVVTELRRAPVTSATLPP